MRGLIRLFLAMACVACSLGVRAEKRETLPDRPTLSAARQRRFNYFFHEGVRLRLAEDYSRAYYCLQHCLEIDPYSADALYEMAIYNLYVLGRDSLGFEQLRYAASLEPKNPDMLEMLARQYLEQERPEEAVKCLEQIVLLQPKRSDLFSALSRLYAQAGDSKRALASLERQELIEGKSLELSLSKFVLLKSMKKAKQAFAEMENLSRENPHDLNIPLVMADLYLDEGQEERALQLMDRVERESPRYPQLQMTRMKYYERKGQDSMVRALCDSMVFSPDVDGQMRLSLVQMRMNELAAKSDSLTDAMRYQRRVAERFPDPNLYALSARFLVQHGGSSDSLLVELHHLVNLDPTNEMALGTLLSYYMSKDSLAAAEEICLKGINALPADLRFSFYMGAIHSQRGHSGEAVDVLKAGIGRAAGETRPEMLSDAYALMGDCYYQMEQHAEAFAAYDSSLVYNPNNVLCLNNYAYFLSLGGERLEKAEQMSYIAIKQEPLNKTYLDTYAWVLYLEENYSMAKFYIDRVVSPLSSDEELLADPTLSPDVIRHAAAIYEANGQEERAGHLRQLALKKEEGKEAQETDNKQNEETKE